jgi:hypothetical protein
MNKSNYFIGQPILSQLLNLLDRTAIKKLAKSQGYDRYYKSFDTYTHLVTMLYCVLNKCTSSREIVTGMKACEHKLYHLGISKSPGKSTLCDANKKRDFIIFEKIYNQLYHKLNRFLSDSRTIIRDKLYIVDSSTITLFQEILKGVSMKRNNGKRKGGIKVHTLIDATEDIAIKINMTPSRDNDMTFLKDINLQPGSFLIFDKGYVDYEQYQRMSDNSVTFVTRQRKGSSYVINEYHKINKMSIEKGVLFDYSITLGTRTHAKGIKLKARLIGFYDKEKDRRFEFLTNNFDLTPEQIADLYKKRWQIELLFKRVKQNFPLKYFIGDNANAIKIQIWVAFIADLLIKFIHNKIKRKWAYSNLVSMIRIHLMSYIHLIKFLNNPDKLKVITNTNQLVIPGLELYHKT